MRLDANTKVHDLLTRHPFLEDFLVAKSAKFEMLRNRMARATIGRVATLRTAAGIANLDLPRLLESLAAEIERQSGTRPELDMASATTASPSTATAASSSAPPQTRAQRIVALKGIIQSLHDGGDVAAARARFAEAVNDVEATEIANMEEELIRGGLPVTEVQRLCDVHVGAFREALDEHPELAVAGGHPVDTYLADNRVISRLANQAAGLARAIAEGNDAETQLARAAAVLRLLGGVENHYLRKEHQLFAVLERHGITGPSRVMWGVDDQIRAALKQALDTAAVRKDAKAFAEQGAALARELTEMVYKEEKILLPMAMQTLSEAEWSEVRRGEDELGYGLARPAAPWPPAQSAPEPAEAAAPSQDERAATTVPAAASAPVAAGVLQGLMTGNLSLEQVNLVFSHLPADLSFVDENDTVQFYSEGPHRIFPRSPAAIGRKVQLCHPPKSLHIVQDILDSFRAGTQSVAEFWIELQGRLVHIRYFAVRDAAGAYRGCLEVTQDVTEIRKLQGQRRLLAWKDGALAGGAGGAAVARA